MRGNEFVQNYKQLLLGLMITSVAASATAQQHLDEPAMYSGSWGVSGEVISFDPVVAAHTGISDTGVGMGFGYSGEKGLFNFSTGMSFFFVDDEAEFSQPVENDWTGDQSTEESSIDAGSFYIDGGIQMPLTANRSLVVGVNAGYRYFDIDRSISNCRDCYSQDISVDNDTYLKPFARFIFNDQATGTLAYYNYSGDKGAENSVQLALDWHF